MVGVALLAAVGVGVWLFVTRGRESTDDAQVDGHVTQMAARVGGTVLRVNVVDNQAVKAGDVLVEIDQSDYQIALDKARAELADAEAAALGGAEQRADDLHDGFESVTSAEGTLEQARAAAVATEREVEAAHARLSASQAREREAQANATKAARDVERLKGLLAKEEVPQQQYRLGSRRGRGLARRRGFGQGPDRRVRRRHPRSGEPAGSGEGRRAAGERRPPQQRDRPRADDRHPGPSRFRAGTVDQAKATLAQAELNLKYTTVYAPTAGVIARKSVNPGQVIQPGQPLFAIVQVDGVWVTANFKETQLAKMRPGRRRRSRSTPTAGASSTGKVDSIAAATGAGSACCRRKTPPATS